MATAGFTASVVAMAVLLTAILAAVSLPMACAAWQPGGVALAAPRSVLDPCVQHGRHVEVRALVFDPTDDSLKVLKGARLGFVIPRCVSTKEAVPGFPGARSVRA